jgi:hypothetical protein
LEKINVQLFDNSKKAAKYFQTSWENTTPAAVATFNHALANAVTRSTLTSPPLKTTRITSVSEDRQARVIA